MCCYMKLPVNDDNDDNDGDKIFNNKDLSCIYWMTSKGKRIGQMVD